MNNNEEKISPPYGSVNRLKHVFDLFSTHNFSPITSALLKSRGFSGTDAFQTISALKFLKIIDNEGNRTEKMTGLQLRGDERTNAILDIIKNAYNKLFEAVNEPNKLSKDDLYNDFISVYGLSGRLASTAVPNFLWLCKEAGLEVLESPEIKERKPRSRNISATTQKSKQTESKITPVGYPPESFSSHDKVIELGEFKLVLPSDWDTNKMRQAIVTGELKAVYSELTKLSSKMKITREKNTGEVAER